MKQEYKKPLTRTTMSITARLLAGSTNPSEAPTRNPLAKPAFATNALTEEGQENQECCSRVRYSF